MAVPAQDDPQPARRGLLRRVVPLLVVVGSAAAFGWMLLSWQAAPPPAAEPHELPLVKADPRPVKVKPEEPGGLRIDNQDKGIYARLAGDAADGAVRERLLPPPETPPPPQPLPVAEPATPPADEAAPPADAAPALPPLASAPIPVSPMPGVPPTTVEAPAPAAAAPPFVAPPPPPTPEPAPSPTPATPEPAAPPAAVPAPQEPPPAAAPAPAPPAQSGDWYVQLAAYRSEAAARSAWSMLQDRHAAALGSLSIRVARADLGDRGVFYRLQAGGLADRDAAAAVCAQLKARDQGCLVVGPG